MKVNLGAGDAAVSEELFHGVEVGSGGEEFSREVMSEGMGSHSLGQASGLTQAAEHPSYLARGDGLVFFPGEERGLRVNGEPPFLVELQELGHDGLRGWIEWDYSGSPDAILAFGDGRRDEELLFRLPFVRNVVHSEASHLSNAKARVG